MIMMRFGIDLVGIIINCINNIVNM